MPESMPRSPVPHQHKLVVGLLRSGWVTSGASGCDFPGFDGVRTTVSRSRERRCVTSPAAGMTPRPVNRSPPPPEVEVLLDAFLRPDLSCSHADERPRSTWLDSSVARTPSPVRRSPASSKTPGHAYLLDSDDIEEQLNLLLTFFTPARIPFVLGKG